MHPIAIRTSNLSQSDSLRGDYPIKFVGLVVMCAPLWWVLGLNLVIYHLTAAILFAALVVETSYDNRRLSVSPVACLLLAISVIYGFSILLNVHSHDTMRIVAAANNLSYWLMAVMLVIGLSARFRLHHLPGLLRLFAILGVCNALFVVIFVVVASRGVYSLSIPTPLSPLMDVLGRTALVEYSVNIRFITEDWFSGRSVARLNLYAPYPTAAGAFFMISLPMLLAWGARNRRLSSPLFWLLFLGNFLGMTMTLARMAIAALGASLAIVYVLQKRSYLVAWGFLCFVILVLATPWLQHSANSVITAREGSSLSRFSLYQESINKIEGLEWVVGRGIRTPSVEQRMPLGSHSTYVSLLYRTGLCGLSIFLLLQAVLLVRWYRLKEYVRSNRDHRLVWMALGVVFFSMAFWMLTEDIDAPQLLAFLYFSAIGVFEGLRRELVSSQLRYTVPEGEH